MYCKMNRVRGRGKIDVWTEPARLVFGEEEKAIWETKD